ncbi:MAG: metalloregulator ArsR/SmtB family transcription factor [Gemmatimonadaceae bacterium]|jgi:ArsR family transcriptional regulator|nr:metalloregulator ArsR/SmtB family transcription factor [Gemmatimonadaceae bacterium]
MSTPPVLGHLSALADATRCRLLLALERQECTVSELCQVLRLPQSTVSRHLKTLADEGWVAVRADGASNIYSMRDGLDEAARRLWRVVRESIADSPDARTDAERLRAVIAARRARSEAFFAGQATEWESLRAQLFGARTDLQAMLALADPSWTVGDLGCGTGALATHLAPFVAHVIGVDASREMLTAARARAHDLRNITFKRGDLEALPLEDASLDLATMLLVLHHVAEPVAALTEVRRVLRPGGRLLLVDMQPHAHEEYRHDMGHAWLGFGDAQLAEWLTDAGFDALHRIALPVDPQARGPALFTLTARAVGTAPIVTRRRAPHRPLKAVPA